MSSSAAPQPPKVLYVVFGLTPQETQNLSLFELVDRQWDLPQLRSLLDRAKQDGSRAAEITLEHEFPGIGRTKLLITACRLSRQKGAAQLVLGFRELR